MKRLNRRVLSCLGVFRDVTIGTLFQEQYVITSGLKLDEKVIVEGTQKVRAGMKVNITGTDDPNPDTSQPAAEPRQPAAEPRQPAAS